jgi:hypothetical protein
MKKNIIFASVIYLMCSCGPEPQDVMVNYNIKNISSHNVELTIFFYNHISDTTISISSKGEIKRSYPDMVLDDPFGGAEDSAYIIFDSLKQLIYRRDDGQARNIIEIDSYTGGKVNDHLYQYEYEITDEDYENALPIE